MIARNWRDQTGFGRTRHGSAGTVTFKNTHTHTHTCTHTCARARSLTTLHKQVLTQTLPPHPTQTMNRMSAVCVPLYETLGDNVIEYIVQHAGTKLIVSMVRKCV